MCLNAASECPDKYKRSVISSYVNRAFTHCSFWILLNKEIERLSQVLVNNGYSNKVIQTVIKKKMDNFMFEEQQRNLEVRPPIKIYYRAFMNNAYRTDERVMKEIMARGIATTDPDDKIDFSIYYKNSKTFSMIMKNNLNQENSPLKRSNVIYMYTCPHGDCKLRNNTYIGMTTTSLSRRLTMHLQAGTPKTHTLQEHQIVLSREMLVENTSIIDRAPDSRRLQILEALHIQDLKPGLNVQDGTNSLPLPTMQHQRRLMASIRNPPNT